MGVGDVQVVRVVDDVLRRVDAVRASFQDAVNVQIPFVFSDLRAGRGRARELAMATTDAAIAEQALARLVPNEPGLQPALDAIRAARAVQAMRRPDLAQVSMVRLDLEREVQALDAWKHVRDLTQEQRAAAVERIRAADSADLPADDWKTLAGIVGDDVDGTLTSGLPRAMSSGLPIRDLALNVGNHGPAWNYTSRKFFSGHAYFDVWKASTLPLDVRRARVDELLTGDPLTRTREEWRELTALLQTEGIDVAEHEWFPGIRLELATRRAYTSGYEGARELVVRIETASPAQLDQAQQELLRTGELGSLATAVVNQDRLDAVGITGRHASAVRLRHMLPTSASAAKSWLLDVQRELHAATATGPVAQVRTDALALIDRNLARIEGDRWWRPRDGYSNHPDYAELGRVRATFQLLEKLGAITVSEAPASTAGTTAAGRVADGAERLTW